MSRRVREELLVGLVVVAVVGFVTHQKGLDGRAAATWIGFVAAAWISSIALGVYAERRWPWARGLAGVYLVGMAPVLVLATLLCVAIGAWVGAAILAPAAFVAVAWMVQQRSQESRGPLGA